MHFQRVFVTLACAGFVLLPPGAGKESPGFCRKVIEFLHAEKNLQEIEIPKEIEGVASVPLFVTLRKGIRTRGCAGSFQPFSSSLSKELTRFAVAAAVQDRRFRPVTAKELKDLSITVAFLGDLISVSSLSHFNPLVHGLLLRKGGAEGVVLPGEAKTVSYAVRLACANAGVSDASGASFFLFPCILFSDTPSSE
ncbi:MAG: AMMECR1 domain-containing protein [Candidatus Ratteibacteria bacterium]